VKDINLPKIDTRPTNTNMPDKLSQGHAVTKQSTTGSSKFNNYKGKPHNKNKGTKNYEHKTDQYDKFGNNNSKYKFDNRNNVKFKDKDNVNRKYNDRPGRDDSKNHNSSFLDFKNKNKNYSDKNNSVKS
jgi:hypothetical protein